MPISAVLRPSAFLLVVAIGLAPAAHAERPATLDDLRPLVGTGWAGRATTGGDDVRLELAFRASLGGAFIEEHMRLGWGDAEPSDYHAVYAADPEGGVRFTSFASSGIHVQGRLVVADDGALVAIVDVPGPTGEVTQVARRTTFDGDRMTWVTARRADEGSGDDPDGEDGWSEAYRGELARTPGVGFPPPVAAGNLDERLAALRGFVGEWRVAATWAWGERLEARNVYRPVLGGAWIACDTWAKDGDGPSYHRYVTWFGRDPIEGGDWVCIGFTHDGTTSEAQIEVVGDGGPGSPPVEVRTSVGEGAQAIRQRVRMQPAGDAYNWLVDGPAAGNTSGRRLTLMEAAWRRVNAGGREATPIDASLFAAAGAAVRSFECTATVDAPPAAVFRSWSSAAGVRAFMGIDARVELAVGGPYEWNFLPDAPEGSRGGEGCQVLSWIPDRQLVFTWNAPPTQPETRGRRTWVTVEFEDAGEGRTLVRLTHLGFGEGPHWDETKAYFERAWPGVLERLVRHHAERSDG